MLNLSCKRRHVNGKTATAIYKKPNASAPTVLTYGIDAALMKEATGKYYVDLLLDEAGLWKMAL